MNSTKNWQQCDTNTFWNEEAASAHVVQIYENDAAFLNLLEGFVTGGIAAGDGVVLIATCEHLGLLEQRLKLAGLDVEALKADDQYLPLHAEEILGRIMINDWPNYSLFMETITRAFRQVKKNNRHIRAFGELVAILWAQGNSGATIMLEQLWNMYGEKEPFSLFCAYPKSAFPENSDVSIRNICKTHSKIISGSTNSTKDLTYKNIRQLQL
jgi:hypothetical protein